MLDRPAMRQTLRGAASRRKLKKMLPANRATLVIVLIIVRIVLPCREAGYLQATYDTRRGRTNFAAGGLCCPATGLHWVQSPPVPGLGVPE